MYIRACSADFACRLITHIEASSSRSISLVSITIHKKKTNDTIETNGCISIYSMKLSKSTNCVTMLMVGGTYLVRSVAGFGPTTFRRNAASTTQSNNTVFHRVFGTTTTTTTLKSSKYPIMCGEEIMGTKAHGTSEKPGKVFIVLD